MGTKLVNRLRKLAPICRGQAEIYIEKAAYEIDRLEAENAALREDAERYRWLRPRINNHPSWPAVEALDAAIDQAIQESKK